jgi:hypothetical protein
MREQRSRSQVLFGFLPQQTVDLANRTWKVSRWQHARHVDLDQGALRRELIRQTAAWAGNDNGFIQSLFQGRSLELRVLDNGTQVRVDPYPNVWMCRACRRLRPSPESTCKCGTKRWGQLPFVGYHDCGAITEPFFKSCPEHRDKRITLPGTASAAEIRIDCPQCGRVLQRGFGFPKCACGNGSVSFNVHRAASVFTPRTVVIVNPPSREQMRRLEESGGRIRALSWALDGMTERDPFATGLSKESLVEDLIARGIDQETAKVMAETAASAGQLAGHTNDLPSLDAETRDDAEREAVILATAVALARTRLQDLVDGTDAFSERGELYRNEYSTALSRAGLSAVELIDRFPVLTGAYGFTRGKQLPGESTLNAFRDRDTGRHSIYADLSETEALLFRLQPSRVAQWLRSRDHDLANWSDEKGAHLAILQSCHIPDLNEEVASETPGSALQILVHSYSHRVMRRAAVFAGIDRNGLGELLAPHHLAFFVFAAAKGDFVLGGLQAVFESELADLLDDVVSADHRCVLDPGCARAGAACMACLHVGEPSCRLYNHFLSRSTLSGQTGYFG